MSAYGLLPAAAGAVALIFLLLILQGRRGADRKLKELKANSWGARAPQLFSALQKERLQALAREEEAAPYLAGESGFARIDGVTEADLELSAVSESLCHALSAPGREVFAAWLREPLTDTGELALRTALADALRSREGTRDAVFEALVRAGTEPDEDSWPSVCALFRQEKIGGRRYLPLTVLTLLGFVLLFIRPVAAVLLLVPVLFLDFRTHIAMREKIGPALRGIAAMARLLDAYATLGKINEPSLAPFLARASDAFATFSPLGRWSFLVTTGGAGSGGFGAAALEYLKMLFHPDLILFDRMLGDVEGNRAQALQLLISVGSVGASWGIASLEESGRGLCRAEFLPAGSAFSVEGLVHPLLDAPVPNDLEATGPVLLTGSNASGKSTFLKSAALAAILAQSTGLAPVKRYRAPMYRIMSAMAARDDVRAGESYYAAEVRALGRIVRAAQAGGPPLLVTLDEVLRGTNTTERIAAVSQILTHLAGTGALVLAATHDGELTVLLGGLFRNMHFGEIASEGDVRFDYRLREGPAAGRNAIRLLGAAGFPEEVVRRAEETARHFDETGEWRL